MKFPKRMKSSARFAILGLTAGVVALACEDSTSPSSDLAFLLAASEAADGFQMDVQEMRGPGVPGLVFPRLRFPSVDGSVPDCPENGHGFRCPPTNDDGLSIARSVTFFDAAGAVQDSYDDLTTATVEFELDMSGELRGRRGIGNMERSRTLTASGLEGEETTVTWNGSGSSLTARGHEDPEGRSFSMDVASETEIRDVVVPSPQTDDGWPLSGTITRRMEGTATRAGEVEPIDVTSLVTFNGTSMVEVEIGDETFEIDLATQHRGFGRRVHWR